MAKLRKFVCYRHIERANTRKSKYRKKSYVRGNPTCKIVKFNAGNLTASFSHRIDLVSRDALQIRDNAIESGRTTATRLLEKTLGKNGFRLQVRPYPHHILREHALAAGAGADRFSSGMAHSFGKPAGNAARIKEGQIIISIFVNEANVVLARSAIDKANFKLPKKCSIQVVKLI
jgi:large subunit ribosomal protein L10e